MWHSHRYTGAILNNHTFAVHWQLFLESAPPCSAPRKYIADGPCSKLLMYTTNIFTSNARNNTVLCAKKISHCCIWSIDLYGAETWTLRKVDQKYLESCEMWCWRRMEKISWTDRVRNEEVLHRVKEERNIVHTVKRRLTGLVTSCVETAFWNTWLKES
jgi:hypothetical protein